MREFFRNLFNIYPDEEKKAFLFGCLGFFWAVAVTSGLKFADALFLLHVGAESLPITYKFTACMMIGMAIFQLYAFHHFPAHRIFLGVIFAGSPFIQPLIFVFLRSLPLRPRSFGMLSGFLALYSLQLLLPVFGP